MGFNSGFKGLIMKNVEYWTILYFLNFIFHTFLHMSKCIGGSSPHFVLLSLNGAEILNDE